MRIVKLSDLSEEDKKKIQERQIQNIRTSKKNRIESNKKFNELISKKGEFDTSKHTSTVGRLQKAYKYNETTKKSLDDYYKNNTTSLWKGTQDFVDTAGKIGENTYKGTENGVLSAIQNLGRNMFNLQGMKEEENIFDKVNRQILNSRTELSSAEKSNIIDKMNNYSSQKDLINVIEEKNQKFQEKKNENTLKIQQNTDSTSNPVGKYLAGEIAPGIGQMLPGMLPGIGTTYFISSATGNYHDDAIQRGMTEDQATIYSGTMGIIEGALESLGAKLTKNVGKQLLKKNIKGALVNYGLDIGENFLEESIVEPISEIAAGMYGGKDKADWSNVPQRMIESGVAGALTSAITGGASAIVGGVGSKVTQQNQYVDYNTNKKLDKDSQNWLKQAENIIQENSTPQLLPQLTHNQQNINTQQITPTISNNVQNGGSEQNNSILNNKDVPMLNYQYEKSDNAKINNLRQDANKYFNNSEKAKNYVNMLEQIINDKNIDIRLDSNLKTPDGKVANGSYLNGVITINPNSTKAGEFIAVHELTHAIGTDSMRNIIETYRKSNIEFNTAMENLLQNYNSTELTDEALSDVSAQLFGNQEFINNISQNNPNIFKRIYNEIKYLWHQFRGYKNQDQFIDDLYYKWTQAYNSNKQLNDTNNYSIAGKEGMINAIKTDSRNLDLERNHNKAQQMQMSGNDNETIRQATGWFQDRNGDWKFEFSDKDMSLKNIKLEKNKTYRLGDILEHDTLFTVYPKLKNYKVKFTNLNQSNGVYNIFDKDIKINNNQLDKKQYKSNIEGTLIHEIQHAIQDIENFEGGKSSKKSKLAYYESLGEIEASDTKARFLQEKYKNMDLTNTAPESSKTNPKHQNLEKYLKNRKILDKAKDGVYNYIKKRNEGNYEISKENISKNKKQNMGLVDGRKRRGYVDEIYQGDIETNIEESKLRKIKIDSNGEGKYIDNDGKEYPVFFRFDMDGAFRGKNHKSGVSMWEETIGDMIDDNYECEWDVDENLVERNTLLEKYGVTQEQYDNMSNEEQFKIQQQIALDEGYVTDGASVFDLSNDGIDFFINYEKDHHYLDAPEVHFFTGDITGEGADGENIVIPDKILLKTTSKDIQDIYDEIFYKYDLNDLQAREKANKEFTQRIVDLINKKSSNNESENNSGSFSLNTDRWNNYLENNFKSKGTKTNLEEIKGIAPIAQNKTKETQVTQEKQNNETKAPYRTSEQIVKDKNISDLDAIKEESVKVNTPTIEEANKISNQIGKSVPPNAEPPQSPTIDLINKKRSKEKASLKQIKDTLAQKFVNKGHYIDKLAKETGNKKLTYLYDRTMNTFNEAQISIGDRQVITNKDGTDVEVVGKSIMDIFSEADGANLSNEFDDYLLNKHNISRFAHEKGIFGKQISSTDSQRIVSSYEKQYPKFVKWSKEVSSYNDNNLKDLVRNGLVSEEAYKKLREMYSDYVPTFRDITENITQHQDNSVGGNTLQKATQSNKSILSVKESMAEQTLAIKKAIRINKLGVELYKTLGKASKVNESVSGIDFDPVAIQTLAGDVIAKAKDGTNTFMIFQDGEMTEFKISNELYSAFSKEVIQNKINNSEVTKTLLTPVEKLSKAQRELLTTYSVGFAFNNPIKDFQDALFNTKYSSSQFLKNYTKALYNIGTKGSWYQNYKDNGGTANTYFDYEKGILPNKNKQFGDKIKVVNEILEQAPRLAEYISTIENGCSINEALYNAADITTNFKRGGDITKVVNKYGANFLNASVQGLDKFYRNLSGQNGWKGYAKLAIKAVVWQVAPAVLNGLLLGDDDDYDDLPEYTKDNYFLFKIEDGKFFRIPKGRISSVVGGIARRALETVQGKDVDWKALTDTTINQMAPNNPLKDNIVAPIAQASSNKSWFGGEIVSSRLQKLPVAEQSDESTDKLSKFLGERLKISPKKINYVLDQYSGGIGDVILPMLTPQAENNIFEDKFTTDAVMKDKHVSEYYSQLEELERNKNSEKSTDVDKLKYMYLSGSSKELGELYQKKRDIQNSDLSDKEKKKQVRDMQMKINAIVENKLNNVDSVRKNEDTATIGNEKYYKYKDEWKKVSDEEAEKMKGISLITYANYQNKVATLSEEKKNKDENITQKDKVKILINSNYTGKEKDKIYSQIINTDDTTYQILKRLDNNKDIINQYLDYLQADLKADREDDGTEKGRAVSGSKKKKVYNYINSIDNKNMSYVQKLYLTGVNTTLSTAEKKKIFTLINENKSLTKEDKLEALDKLQGFTIYKDGKVKW